MSPPDPILVALEAQVGCYQRLAKLAEVQHEHVQRGQTEALIDVLARRQEVLDEASKLETVIAPAKKGWPDYAAGLDPARRASAERLLAETRRLLEQITSADRDDALVLQQRKLNLGKQINQAAAARQVNRTYAAAAYGARRPGMDIKQ